MAQMDWLGALDFAKALENCHADILGDWYRDPWGWPELDWVVPRHLETFVVPRLNASGVRRAVKLDVAKENFAIRPAVVLDPIDRLVYQALVDRHSGSLIGALPASVYGWRLIPETPTPGTYARNDHEWARYRDHLKRLTEYDIGALRTDIVSFFASVSIESLAEEIRVAGGNDKPSERLADLLLGWDQLADRSGLPQRSAASAALAHRYLIPIDRVLKRFGEIRATSGRQHIPEGRALRWVDDIWLFGRQRGRLREAQLALQEAMRDLGLQMNFAKTEILWGPELAEAVFEIEHSAVDAGLEANEPSDQPLNELIDRVVDSPELIDRTTVGFMTTRMRRHGVFDRVQDIAKVAHRMPQAPDHLARLFRDSGAWREMDEWYVKYATSAWGKIDWSVAQLGTMFPSRRRVAAVSEFFGELLVKKTSSLALTSVAAQRFASWDSTEARFVLRDAARDADHALFRRSHVLAGIAAGENRTTIRPLLREFEENAVTLAMLEETDFRRSSIRPKPDFG
jgi:hypothetical protein